MNEETDRRTEPRMSTRLEAIIDDEQYGTRVFTVSGYSSTGAFLQRRDNSIPLPAVGSVVQLQFKWPPEAHIAPIFVEATVVRQQDDGVGVQFDITA